MPETCAECGAPLPVGGACRDLFHALLALEAEAAGAAGELPHFLAVATYNLQHAAAFTPAALAGLRATLADVLAGRATVDDARRRARAGAARDGRVTRRAGDAPTAGERALLASWPVAWPLTVADVLTARPAEYATRVRAWAAAVSAALDAAIPPAGPGRADPPRPRTRAGQ